MIQGGYDRTHGARMWRSKEKYLVFGYFDAVIFVVGRQSRAMDYNDASKYGLRDLLLVLQLLHSNGLLDLEQMKASPEKVAALGQEWFNHKSTRLSVVQEGRQYKRPPTSEELIALYEQLLQKYEDCTNTTDLAYAVYYARMEQLEKTIQERQQEAAHILSEIGG